MMMILLVVWPLRGCPVLLVGAIEDQQPFDHVAQGNNRREWRFHRGKVDVIDSDEEFDTPDTDTPEGEADSRR